MRAAIDGCCAMAHPSIRLAVFLSLFLRLLAFSPQPVSQLSPFSKVSSFIYPTHRGIPVSLRVASSPIHRPSSIIHHLRPGRLVSLSRRYTDTDTDTKKGPRPTAADVRTDGHF
ncbi:uncharacterized protein J3D65DRAFT_636294 [Phyllosticta citribraziliensis]|uniref:Secreted protein n=1 Tax=Phyllosticta citribraziliensis TaxID=989973 RepID=A0ABR1LAJ3_9PEZI